MDNIRDLGITEQSRCIWSPTWSLYTKQGLNLSFQYPGGTLFHRTELQDLFLFFHRTSVYQKYSSLLKHTEHQIVHVLVQFNLQNPKSSFTTHFNCICHPVGSICWILLSSPSTVQEGRVSLLMPALELGWFSTRKWSWPTHTQGAYAQVKLAVAVQSKAQQQSNHAHNFSLALPANLNSHLLPWKQW